MRQVLGAISIIAETVRLQAIHSLGHILEAQSYSFIKTTSRKKSTLDHSLNVKEREAFNMDNYCHKHIFNYLFKLHYHLLAIVYFVNLNF